MRKELVLGECGLLLASAYLSGASKVAPRVGVLLGAVEALAMLNPAGLAPVEPRPALIAGPEEVHDPLECRVSPPSAVPKHTQTATQTSPQITCRKTHTHTRAHRREEEEGVSLSHFCTQFLQRKRERCLCVCVISVISGVVWVTHSTKSSRFMYILGPPLVLLR